MASLAEQGLTVYAASPEKLARGNGGGASSFDSGGGSSGHGGHGGYFIPQDKLPAGTDSAANVNDRKAAIGASSPEGRLLACLWYT